MFAISGIISKFECNFVIYTKINELGVKYFYKQYEMEPKYDTIKKIIFSNITIFMY